MRILLVHNYFHIVGGAESYFFNIAELLRQKGHTVVFFSMKDKKNFQTVFERYFVSNFPPLKELGLSKKIRSLFKVFYSFEARKKIRQLIEEQKPDVVHIHNIWHEITFSLIYEIRKYNIPIVMTLHDYRMICPNHQLYTRKRLCYKCNNGNFINSLINKCIGGSLVKSFYAFIYNYIYIRILKVQKAVSIFIAPSKFLYNKFRENKLYRDVELKYIPYSIDIKKWSTEIYKGAFGNSIIYFGRLGEEKGISLLIEAVKDLDINLKIIGTGLEENKLKKQIKRQQIKNVFLLGFMSQGDIKREINQCLFSVLPSLWYEVSGISIIESFSMGKPVIASRIGGITELIKDGINGLLVKPGDVNDLKEKITTLKNNFNLINLMGMEAKRFAEINYNSENHYKSLSSIYNEAINRNY